MKLYHEKIWIIEVDLDCSEFGALATAHNLRVDFPNAFMVQPIHIRPDNTSTFKMKFHKKPTKQQLKIIT